MAPAAGRATTPAVDCTGRQVRWEAPALGCDDAATARALLPDRPLGDADVVSAPISSDERLGWLVSFILRPSPNRMPPSAPFDAEVEAWRTLVSQLEDRFRKH